MRSWRNQGGNEMNKLMNAEKAMEKAVTNAYVAVETAVVAGYKAVESATVAGYRKIEDGFVEKFLTRDGESLEEAKARLKQ